jgi:hypothetical protein
MLICVGDTYINGTAIPPMRTEPVIVPKRLVPVTTIDVPIGPLVGVKLVIVGGAARKVKPPNCKVADDASTTRTSPDAPKPRTAVICVLLVVVKLAAFVVLNCTFVATTSRSIPVIVTVPPAAALVGAILVIEGRTNRKPGIVAGGATGVATDTEPVTAFAGTTALTAVALSGVYIVAATPPKLTAVTPVRFVPVIVTV